MFASVGKAAAMLFEREFAGLVFWSLVLSAIVFVALFVGVEYILAQLPPMGSVWVNRFFEVAAPLIMLLAVFFLGAPVAAMVGSLFLERIAAKVDARFYPNDPPAPGTPAVTSIGAALRLIALALVFNIALLPLDVGLPGIAELATLIVNGWLLGREFFELASLRHLSPQQSDALRRRYPWRIFGGGMAIAVTSMIPVLDLVAPFFGAALMAHLFKRLTHLEGKA